jgi:hypothetical protein
MIITQGRSTSLNIQYMIRASYIHYRAIDRIVETMPMEKRDVRLHGFCTTKTGFRKNIIFCFFYPIPSAVSIVGLGLGLGVNS